MRASLSRKVGNDRLMSTTAIEKVEVCTRHLMLRYGETHQWQPSHAAISARGCWACVLWAVRKQTVALAGCSSEAQS